MTGRKPKIPKSLSMDCVKKNAFIIGVSGGSCSGKTAVCEAIWDGLRGDKSLHKRVVILSQDVFYKHDFNPNDEEQIQNYNFDHPDAFDVNLMVKTITAIRKRQTVHVTQYDSSRLSKADEDLVIPPVDVLILEGILVLYFPEVRRLLDMKVYVDLDSDERLSARVLRDIEKGRSLERILQKYMEEVKPGYEEFISPSKKYADVILPRGPNNIVAVQMLVEHIQSMLQQVKPPNPDGGEIHLGPSSPVRPSPIKPNSIPH